MNLLNAIILTTAIGSTSHSSAASTDKAIEATLKSVYIQNGYEDKVIKWEKKYTPQYIKDRPWMIYGIKILHDKKISFQWSF